MLLQDPKGTQGANDLQRCTQEVNVLRTQYDALKNKVAKQFKPDISSFTGICFR